jgi:hypothetical protein
VVALGGLAPFGRCADAIADYRKAQSIDSTDRVSEQHLRMLGF